MKILTRFLPASAGFLLTVALSGGANAAVVSSVLNQNFGAAASSFSYLGSTFRFSDISGGSFTPNPVAITTTGGAKVTSLSLFGLQPTVYFDPVRGSGLNFDSSYQYSAFASPTAIPFSATPSFIGLSVSAGDGIHYGYAEFSGTFLQMFGFESTPGVGIAAGAVTAIPEPQTYVLMLAGLCGLVCVTRLGRKN